MSKRRLEQTAWHEAGHAVIAFFHDLPVRYATIRPREDSLGHVMPGNHPKWMQPDVEIPPRTEARIRKTIEKLLAGREAAWLVTGRYNNVGASGDDRQAFNLATHLCDDDEAAAYLAWVRIRARNMVRRPHVRVSIEAVAQALLARKRLSGNEIKAVIREAISSPEGIERIRALQLEQREEFKREQQRRLSEFKAKQAEK